MVGSKGRSQEHFFIPGTLRDLIPEDHILKQVDRVLDLRWVRDEVKGCYSAYDGRPSIDPECAVRLMLAGFFQGIVHDRKLMREAQVNMAIRWFAGYELDEKLPDHSSLTRIRQRWGAERFRRIFERTVGMCVEAGLVNAETVHVDSTLIRANVSWKSLAVEHAERVLKENVEEGDSEEGEGPRKRGRPRTRVPRLKKRSWTDPDATLTTASHDQRMIPCYKQHTVVEDKTGVVLDVAVTTGETSEGTQLLAQIERVERTTGQKVKTVTADTAYAHPKNYAELERQGIEAVIPPPKERGTARKLPLRRFKYDGQKGVVKCPAGKYLHQSYEVKNGWLYRARQSDCQACVLKERCLPASKKVRMVQIVQGYEALLRARRRRACGWDDETRAVYRRHQWQVEGRHGEAKVVHGLSRAVRRRWTNVAIQVYLTAVVMNLKRLATGFNPLPSAASVLVHTKSLMKGVSHTIKAILSWLVSGHAPAPAG